MMMIDDIGKILAILGIVMVVMSKVMMVIM